MVTRLLNITAVRELRIGTGGTVVLESPLVRSQLKNSFLNIHASEAAVQSPINSGMILARCGSVSEPSEPFDRL